MADVNDSPVAPVEDAAPVEVEAAAEPEEASPEVEAPAAEEAAQDEPSAPESTAEVVTNGVDSETNGVEEQASEEEKPAEEVVVSPKGAKRGGGRRSKGESPAKKPKVSTPGGRASSRLKNQESGTKLAKEITSDNLPNRRKSRGAVADEA